MTEYVETKDSYIRRALADLYTLLDEVGSDTNQLFTFYELESSMERVIKLLEQALKVPYFSPDSSADASKPDTE